jgi:hypothetical protein
MRGIEVMSVILAALLVLSAAAGVADDAKGMILPKAPVKVMKVIFWEDGGTTGIVLVDSTQKEFQVCLDGRMRGKQVPRHLYLGATHPTGKGALELGLGGVEEKEILRTLERWLTDNVSPEEREKLHSATTVVGLSEQEIDQLRIVRMVEFLEKRNQPNKSMDHDKK